MSVCSNTSETGFNAFSLEEYFAALSAFEFAKASELIKKKKNLSGIPYSVDLSSALVLLAACENMYNSLSFLDFVWPRKGALKNMYEHVTDDLGRVSSILQSSVVDAFAMVALVDQLSTLVKIRKGMCVIYRTISAATYPMKYSEMEHVVGTLCHKCDELVHTSLSDMRDHASTELAVLLKLLQAQEAIASMMYIDAITLLSQCRTMLDFLLSLLKLEPIEEMGSSNSKTRPPRAGHALVLFQWLAHFYRALMAKFTFYFHTPLAAIEEKFGGDIASRTAKLSVDYINIVQQFQARSDASLVCLVLNASSPHVVFRGEGYVCPEPADPSREVEVVSGLKAWPAVFCYPPRANPSDHWPNIVSIIMDNTEALEQPTDHPLYYYDRKIQCTYFLAPVEPLLTLVVVFLDERKSGDKVASEFFSTMCSQLRNQRVFGLMKTLR